MNEADFDTQAIVCWRCNECLNGCSLWIVPDLSTEPVTLCETCYANHRGLEKCDKGVEQ